MKIHYARKRFATNSSSSHSIVFFSGDELPPDFDGDEYFGWNSFTLSSPEAKQRYLDAILKTALRQKIGEATASMFFKEEIDEVDHQSQWVIPAGWDGRGIDKTFWDEFSAFIHQRNVLILGGHDNLERGDDGKLIGEHPLKATTEKALPPRYPRESRDEYVARKDGNYWTMFNRANGDKLRFSFDRAVDKPVRATYPELVDLKITDYCPFGCTFCYQASTAKGEHAELKEVISPILSGLGDAHVFEIAIGGGEPTLHPEFIEILEEARRCHIVPNFTTKNFDFFSDKNWRARDKALSLCGAFALSVQTVDEVDRVRRLIVNGAIKNHEQLTIQHIVGVDESIEDFEKFLMALSEPLKNKQGDHWYGRNLTLLGFKTTGRGLNYVNRNKIPAWISLAKRATTYQPGRASLRISIDTVLAYKHFDQLRNAGVSDVFLDTHDGDFSLYIDAVEKYIAPNSYELDASLRTKLPLHETNKWNSKERVNSWELKQTLTSAIEKSIPKSADL